MQRGMGGGKGRFGERRGRGALGRGEEGELWVEGRGGEWREKGRTERVRKVENLYKSLTH